MSLVLDERLLDPLDPAPKEAGFSVSRTCSKCGETKPLTDEFYRFYSRPHRQWHDATCRDCRRAANRAYMQEKYAGDRDASFGEEHDLLSLPPVTDAEVAWKQRGRCRGDLRWFQRSTRQQKEACATCTVKTECRALCDLVESTVGFRGSHNKMVGVWGGESPADRRNRRKFIAELQGGVRGGSR